jgi:amino acid transporter
LAKLNLDPFAWWIITISWSIAFLIVVGIYLYAESNIKRKKKGEAKPSTVKLAKDFVFVWVLLGLLVFYIVSVNVGSPVFFAVGNIVVEAILIIYIVKNRQKSSG